MRAYVITGNDLVIGLRSSKKLAIEACEKHIQLGGVYDADVDGLVDAPADDINVVWGTQEKHNGGCYSMNNDNTATYEMFYVNEDLNDGTALG